MSSLRRGAAAAVTAASALALLSACGGSHTPTGSQNYTHVSTTQYLPTNGISLDSTYIFVRNLYLLTPDATTPARLSMTLVNLSNTNDAVIGAQVGVPAVNGALSGGTLGAVPVVPFTSVIVGSGGGPDITFPGYDPLPGTFVPVTLLFRSGRAVSGSVLVQDASSEHSDGTIPFGTASALPTTGSPTPTAVATPSTSVTLDPLTGQVEGQTQTPSASSSPTATASTTATTTATAG